VIGGSSLGGMIAIEIGKLVKPRALTLIGSTVNPVEVQELLTMLAPLAAMTHVNETAAFLARVSQRC
jgi:hypothetical protein